MANALYPKSKAQYLKGAINLMDPAIDVRVVAVDLAFYTYNAAHEFLSDVPGGSRIKTTGPLQSRTVNLTTGSFDSDDPTMEAVTGADIDAVIMYIKGASDAASRLLMFQDTNITTVPFTPDGSDVRIVVDATGWFVL